MSARVLGGTNSMLITKSNRHPPPLFSPPLSFYLLPEPIRKAIGTLVGVNRFSSAREQLAVLGGASELADSLTGLSLVMGLTGMDDDGGMDLGDGGGGGDAGGDSGAGAGDQGNMAMLVDAVYRTIQRQVCR